MSIGIGESLRAARQERGLELEEVEARLKIRRRYLEALESEDWDRLPAPSYARGFLRTYAGYLGLDGKRMAAKLGEGPREPEMIATPERRPRAGPVDPTPIRALGRRSRMPQPSARAGWVGLTAVLGLIAVFAAIGLLSSESDPERDPTAGAGQQPRAERQREQREPPEPERDPVPRRAEVVITATADVWACVVDERGEPLIDGVTLAADGGDEKLRAERLDMNFGNGALTLEVNGEPVEVGPAANPIGYRATPDGVRELDPARRPTCG